MNFMRVLVYMFLSFWVMIGTAEVYKWTDANGKMHYSDKPVTKAQKNKKLEIKATVSKADAAAARERLDKRIANQKRDEASKKVKQSQDNMRALNKPSGKGTLFSSCGESKSKLNQLKNKVKRKYTFDKATGERRWMDDKQINSEIAKHQSNVNKKCK